MNLKSKSTLLKTIITQADEILTNIPSYDHDGMPVEESCDLDNYISSLSNIRVKNAKGDEMRPFDICMASSLIYDEMEERRETPNGQS